MGDRSNLLEDPAGELGFEPYELHTRHKQYEIYQHLREHAPAYRTKTGYWAVTRYDDVRTVITDNERFSATPNQDEVFGMPTFDGSADGPDIDPEAMAPLLAIIGAIPVPMDQLLAARIMVAADPPQHTRIRRLVARAFNPRLMDDCERSIAGIVEECLTGIDGASTYEVVQRLAVPVPVRTLANILSMGADYMLVKRWTDLAAHANLSEMRGTVEGLTQLLDMLREFSQYFVPMIEDRRENPRGDLISELVEASGNDMLSVAESMFFLNTVLQGGNESSTSMIGNIIVNLYQHPEQLDLVLADPDLIPAVVDESLRYRSPVQFVFRKTLVDVEIGGTTIPAGEVVVPVLAAANTDPRHFEEPERFDITRPHQQNLYFGLATHYCIGAHLARLEGRLALAGILPHLRDFELGEVQLGDMPLMYGHRKVELVRR